MNRIKWLAMPILMGLIMGGLFAMTPPNIKEKVQTEWYEILQKIKWIQAERPEDKVYVQLDKPMYKPGETVWFTAYVRNGTDLKNSDKSGIVHVEWINPKGAVEKKVKTIAKNGLAKGDFIVNETGGLYTLKAYTEWQKNDPNPAYFEKEVTVQKAILPRLKMKLDLLKKAYGSGDKVSADLTLETNANQPLANQTIRYRVKLEGGTFLEKTTQTGDNGEALIQFDLPKNLTSNDGLINVMIEYQGQTESIARSIPIILNKIDLQFFPEGGDLVANAESKVAFRAMNEFRKPADIEGFVKNSKGKIITRFASYHQGLGAFDLTPETGETYHVKITKPAGIDSTFIVPKAAETGYSFTIQKVTKNDVYVKVYSPVATKLGLVAQVRGKVYFNTNFEATQGSQVINFPIKEFPIGVAQVTLFDDQQIEQAERLVFVNKHRQLNIDIKTHKEKYLPREKVRMSLKVTDEKGRPVQGDFSMSVVDDQLLSFADDKSSNILSWLLLESDIKETVEEPNFYFDKKDPVQQSGVNRDKALDLVLMTSGWRRFTWEQIRNKNLPQIVAENESTTIKGRVFDNATSEPIKNALVQIKSTKEQVRTDANGSFTFKEIDITQSPIIRITRRGFKPRETKLYSYQQERLVYMEPLRRLPVKRNKSSKSIAATQTEEAPIPQRPNPTSTTAVKDLDKAKAVEFARDNAEKLVLPEDIAIEPPRTAEPPPPVIEEVPDEEIEEEPAFEDMSIEDDVVEIEAPMLKKEMARPKPKPRPKAKPKPKPVPRKNWKKRQAVVDEIFAITAQMPRFPGCENTTGTNAEKKQCADKRMVEFIYDNLRYPLEARESCISGVAVVQFVIDEKGRIIESKVIRDIGGGTKEEVLRIIKKMQQLPNWTPAKQRNRAVKMQYNLPIRFRLTERCQPVQQQAKEFYRARVFPKPVHKKKKDIVRDDFRSTIYWNGHIQTNRRGFAQLEFTTSDAITSFRTTVEGLGKNGQIGRAEQQFYTQLPFSMATKLPIEVVEGDELQIPLTLVNNTDKAINGQLNIEYPDGLQPKNDLLKTVTLAPNQAITKRLIFDVLKPSIQAQLFSVAFKARGLEDAVQQDMTIVPRGFPTAQAYNGTVADKTFEVEIKDLVDNSLKVQFTAYPSTVGEVMAGLASMLREPRGCFEQTSSSTYPNILVLNYLLETEQSNPVVTKRAKYLIDKGYKRLTSFESKSGGFEWFGGDPGHEGLTAYGLMEFSDMKKVYDGVDQTMLDRTAKWLMAKRDGTGRFARNPRALHQFGLANNETMSIYITWALVSGGYGDLDKEIDFAYSTAMQSKNPYQLGLTANLLYLAKQPTKAKTVLEELMSIQLENGAWTFNKQRSAPGSSGKALSIETAALALSALLKSKNPHNLSIKKCVDFLQASKSPYGGFGNTNSTVLALKALIEYAKYSKKTEEGGTIEVYVNEAKVATRTYEKGTKGEVVIPNLAQYLKAGKQQISVKYIGVKNPLPYTVSVNYHTKVPQSAAACVVHLTTELKTPKAKVGETVRLTATLENKTTEGQPMTIAIIGIPAGLSAQPYQLKELTEQKKVDFYEITDNQLVLYYRQMKPSEKRIIQLDLKAELAGQYEASASSAYLYYTNELKYWTKVEDILIE